VLRTEGAGRIPEFVQIKSTGDFRINRSADDWPTVTLPPFPTWIEEKEAAAAIAAVRETSTGKDPTAFEKAACDAFALLGFETQHFGANAQPDAVLTAPLGQEAYRSELSAIRDRRLLAARAHSSVDPYDILN